MARIGVALMVAVAITVSAVLAGTYAGIAFAEQTKACKAQPYRQSLDHLVPMEVGP